jgi:uncharacterized protein (DUF433 family)
MRPEDYFEFFPNGAMRLKGHRIGIEHVLYEHQNGMNMEQLLERFPTLNQEKIQACLDYYAEHKEELEATFKQLDEEFEKFMEEQERKPQNIALKKKLLAAKERMQAGMKG